jgi:hypothetical protein
MMKNEKWFFGTLERENEKWVLKNAYGTIEFGRVYQKGHFNMSQLGRNVHGKVSRNRIVNYHLEVI